MLKWKRLQHSDTFNQSHVPIFIFLSISFYVFSALQEDVTTITLNKYRKIQGMLEDAEQRADAALHQAIRGRRSMSISRETYKVVKA